MPVTGAFGEDMESDRDETNGTKKARRRGEGVLKDRKNGHQRCP